MADEEKKKELVKRPSLKPAAAFDVDAKVEKIMKSKLPQDQKDAYARKLKTAKAKPEERIRFGAYANQRGIKPAMRAAMKAYPKAKGVISATQQQWEEIYKDF